MTNSSNYLILAFYHFTKIENPIDLVKQHKEFFQGKDVSCRIYISEQGINAQFSGRKDAAEEYRNWLKKHPLFQNVFIKVQEYHENVFPRITVKYRKNLVGFDRPIDLSKRGDYVTPKTWQEMLQKYKEEAILLDVRNNYEWDVGRFEGAECPPCQTFRDFDVFAENLKSQVNPKTTPVMMYCTAGIRAELYSALLIEKGFEKVYQLEGGIVNYGQKVGCDKWLGKVFVFDDRLTVPISEQETAAVGKCHHCQTTTEAYYNCASMKCNHLFLCCPSCLKKYQGCCKEECKNSEKLRPFYEQNPHKPFRKWYNYFPEKEKSAVE